MIVQQKRRCSSLPTFLSCPSSALPVEHPYDPPSEVGSLGDAVHVALAMHAVGSVPNLDTIAVQHSVDRDELDRLVAYGRIAWTELSKYFPNARTEATLEGRRVRGHADLFHDDGVTMCIGDWKSGRVRRNHRAQVVGYAAAAVDMFGMPESGEVKVFIIWLQFFEFEVFTITQAEIDSLHDDIKRAEINIGGRYAPGDTCTYCPRQLVCNARHDFLRSATAALAPVGQVDIDPSQLPRLYTKAKALRKALSSYDTALKLLLRDGPLPDGEGGMLELDEIKKDKIDARKAWPHLLAAGLTEDELASFVTIGKTRMLKVISDRAEKGMKGKDKAAFVATLREYMAITQTVAWTVKVRGPA